MLTLNFGRFATADKFQSQKSFSPVSCIVCQTKVELSTTSLFVV